ncbi:MAG: FMN-binding protein [Chloroflexota bacterium]
MTPSRPDPRPTPKRTKNPSRLPVRGVIGLGVTAGGLAMLLSLKPPAESTFAFAIDPADDAGTTTTLAMAATTPAPTAAATASASASPVASASPAASASASPSASPSPSAAATTSGTQTAVGDAVSFRYGVVQVQVTVENGVITDITALQLPDEDNHSYRISQQVEPMLQSEALSAQSADISVISGATYTSLAYAQSLQSALDRLA